MRSTTLPRILALAALALPASGQELDYANLADAFLSDHDFEDSERDTFELDLARRCAGGERLQRGYCRLGV